MPGTIVGTGSEPGTWLVQPDGGGAPVQLTTDSLDSNLSAQAYQLQQANQPAPVAAPVAPNEQAPGPHAIQPPTPQVVPGTTMFNDLTNYINRNDTSPGGAVPTGVYAPQPVGPLPAGAGVTTNPSGEVGTGVDAASLNLETPMDDAAKEDLGTKAGLPKLKPPPGSSAAAQLQPGTGVTNYIGQYAAGQGLEAKGITGTADVAGNIGRDQAVVQKQAATDLQTIQDQQQQAVQEGQTNAKALLDKASQATTDFMNARVDPHHMWNNMSTSSKILAGVSLFLGAIGAGGNGGHNVGAELLMKTRDDDIKQQEDAIGRGEKGSGMLSKLASDYTARGLSGAQALEMAKGTLKDKVNQQLAETISNYASPAAAALAMQELGKTMEAGATNKQNVAGSVLDQEIKKVQLRQSQNMSQLMQPGAATGESNTAQMMEQNPMIREMLRSNGKVDIAPGIPEAKGKLLTVDDAKALESSYVPLHKALDAVTRIQELRKGGVFPGSASMGALETEEKNLANALSDAKGTKELSTRSIDVWQDFLPGITDHTDFLGKIQASGDELKNTIMDELDDTLTKHVPGYRSKQDLTSSAPKVAPSK